MSCGQLIIFLSALVLLTSTPAFAQDVTQANPNQSREAVNWDKIDSKLYNDLKAKYGKDDAEIYQAMAYSHLKYENWDRAEDYFKKALDLNPNLYMSWYNLALLNLDTEEGNGYLKKAIEANLKYPQPYYWLAYTYCRHSKDKEAVPLFEKFLEVTKGYPNEISRIRTATKLLEELRSGNEGEELKKIRELANE